MLQLSKVHVYSKVPNTSEVRMTGYHPYLRLCANGASPIFIQDGEAWSEGGQPYEKLPGWFWDELDKASPALIEECKWEKKRPVEAKVEKPKVEVEAAKVEVEAKPKAKPKAKKKVKANGNN